MEMSEIREILETLVKRLAELKPAMIAIVDSHTRIASALELLTRLPALVCRKGCTCLRNNIYCSNVCALGKPHGELHDCLTAHSFPRIEALEHGGDCWHACAKSSNGDTCVNACKLRNEHGEIHDCLTVHLYPVNNL